MDKVRFLNRKLDQAYEQTPWRRQIQAIGIFMLVVVVVALVAGINLIVTSRAATYGREIQDMTWGHHVYLDDVVAEEIAEQERKAKGEPGKEKIIPIEDLKIQIADLEAELAELTSSEVMKERAEQLKFQQVDPASIVYIKVPGYPGRSQALLAPPPEPITTGSKVIPQAYRESLLDWLTDEIANSWLLQSPTKLLLEGVNP